MKENKLIQACQKGEAAAQRELFDTYYRYIYTVCHRYLRHHQDTEDVVLIVFNKVFSNIDKVYDIANDGLKRWMQTISINESLRFIKKKHPIDYTADYNIFEGQEENNIAEDRDIQTVKEAIDEMPDGYRTIFLLNVVEGLSHTEIATHLGISRNTSKSQMLKARNYLQKKLNSYASR